MNDEQLLRIEQQYIEAAINALRAAAHAHGQQDQKYDENWMNALDRMILELRARDSAIYKHQSELVTPAGNRV